jgi:hypothetical protein
MIHIIQRLQKVNRFLPARGQLPRPGGNAPGGGRQDAEARQYFGQANRAMDDFGAAMAGLQ